MDVSRETARLAFGGRLPVAEAYADMLCTDGVLRGLIGPREVERLWSRHLLNSILPIAAFPDEGLVLDVGSGAGLPGVPLAIARPGLRVHLIEPLLRRATFLTELVERLGLENVEVVRARAEEVAGEMSAATVTARAVAPMDRLAGWCLPLVSPGGSLLAYKGAKAAEELAASKHALRRLGAASWAVEHYRVADLRTAARQSEQDATAADPGPGDAPGDAATQQCSAGGRLTEARGTDTDPHGDEDDRVIGVVRVVRVVRAASAGRARTRRMAR